MMKTLALSAIGFYQRHLSPYKGFRCAYCAYTGNASCSALGARAIRRYGVWDGLGVGRNEGARSQCRIRDRMGIRLIGANGDVVILGANLTQRNI
ncbi:membrane protein insertion efficiency factor YidD [Massilia sp. CCM 9210]|nr:membrane protein insertion efficiency factor YidD [Massilia sp. CCM 9210]MDQ1813775.1 membrane protein insertion efficiency factor YidD [Massilia sp. CCM 9210]